MSIRDAVFDTGDQPVTQTRQARRLVSHVPRCLLCGGGKSSGSGNIEGARTQRALLATTVQNGDRLDVARQDESADAHRTADLVGRDSHCVDAQVGEVQRQLSESLHGVGVDGHARGLGKCCGFLDRLDGADFVVGVHDRHEGRAVAVFAQQLFQVVKTDAAVFVDIHQEHLRALGFEPAGGVEDGVVLNRGGDDDRVRQFRDGCWRARAFSRHAVAVPEQTLDGEVVGFCAA